MYQCASNPWELGTWGKAARALIRHVFVNPLEIQGQHPFNSEAFIGCAAGERRLDNGNATVNEGLGGIWTSACIIISIVFLYRIVSSGLL